MNEMETTKEEFELSILDILKEDLPKFKINKVECRKTIYKTDPYSTEFFIYLYSSLELNDSNEPFFTAIIKATFRPNESLYVTLPQDIKYNVWGYNAYKLMINEKEAKKMVAYALYEAVYSSLPILIDLTDHESKLVWVNGLNGELQRSKYHGETAENPPHKNWELWPMEDLGHSYKESSNICNIWNSYMNSTIKLMKLANRFKKASDDSVMDRIRDGAVSRLNNHPNNAQSSQDPSQKRLRFVGEMEITSWKVKPLIMCKIARPDPPLQEQDVVLIRNCVNESAKQEFQNQDSINIVNERFRQTSNLPPLTSAELQNGFDVAFDQER